LAKCAFDDPATRQAYKKARRSALVSLFSRVGVFLALLIVAKVFKEEETQLVPGLASFLLIPAAFLLAGPAKALRWLRSVESVLRSHPWRYCSAVGRRDAKVDAGTAVQLRLGDEGSDEDRTPVLAARTWRRRTRWSGEFEHGAWFAGNPDRGGVLALPGGHGLMTLHRQ
jgi:hypothetical protein